MNWSGIILGAATFLLIGIFHPIVIKAEYHWGKGCWWFFVLGGVAFCVTSMLVDDVVLAAVLGVAGFSAFWSVHELFEQEKRVQKGWFPRNPKRMGLLVASLVLVQAAQAEYHTQVLRDAKGNITALRTYKDQVLMMETSFDDGKETVRMLQQDDTYSTEEHTTRCATCLLGLGDLDLTGQAHPHRPHFSTLTTHGAPTVTEGRWSPSLQKPICYNDGVVRTYRLALPVDYSYYSSYYGSNPDLVRASWDQIITFCNEIYMREIGVCFELVDDDNLIIGSDDEFFTTENANSIYSQVTGKLSEYYGSENYDIGVLLHYITNYSGLSSKYGAYRHTGKAASVAIASPTTIAHEIGHLFGASHTFSSNSGNSIAVEPDDGTSLMSYGSPRDFFNLASIYEIRENLVADLPYVNEQGETLGTTSGSFNNFVHGTYTGNRPPCIDHTLLPDTIIVPKGSWVGFDVAATDLENDPLHYFIHQADWATPSTSKAKFIAKAAKETPFLTWAPSYSTDKYDPTWLAKDAYSDPPSTGTYTLWLAACDGDWTSSAPHAVNYDIHEMTVIVRSSESPTRLTTDFATSYTGNQWLQLTWDNDNQIFPKSSTRVRVTLSTDAGKTYPILLKDTVPNWRTCYVLLPGNVNTDKAVVRIEVLRRQTDGTYLPSGAYHTSQVEPYTGGFTLVPSSDDPGEEPQVTEPDDDDEEEGEYVTAPALTLPYEAYPLKRRVLIEPFIGLDCGNAPTGMANLSSVLARYDDSDYIAATQHFYSGYLQLDASRSIATAFEITASPRIMVARDGYDQRYMSTPAFYPNQSMIESGLKRNLANSVPVYLTLEGTTYDASTRKLKVTVSGFCSTSIPDPCLSVCLLEDGIYAYQSGQGYITHDHVVRTYLSDELGETLNLYADGHFTRRFTYTLPASLNSYSVNPDQVKVLAFVHTGQPFRTQKNYELSEVWNATAAPVMDFVAGATYRSDPLNLRMEVQQGDTYLGTMCLPYGVDLPEGVVAYEVEASGRAVELSTRSIAPLQTVLLTSTDSVVALTPNTSLTATPASDTNGLSGEFHSRMLESGEHCLSLGINAEGEAAWVPTGQSPTTSGSTYYCPAGSYVPAGRGHLDGTAELPLTLARHSQATLTVTQAHWGTFVAPYPCILEDGTRAYTADVVDDVITFTEVTESTIPANTPVVVYKDVSITYTKTYEGIAPAGVTTCTKGILTGVFQKVTDIPETADGKTNYVLQNGNSGVGFYQVNGSASLNPNRAYMSVPTVAGIKGFVGFDVITGVDAIRVNAQRLADVYNLAGQRVNANYKGVVIMNGKKVLIK